MCNRDNMIMTSKHQCINLEYYLKICSAEDYQQYKWLPFAIFTCVDCGQLYLCNCQREMYEALHKDNLRKLSRKDIITYSSGQTSTHIEVEIYKRCKYKEGICHLCTQTIPNAKWGNIYMPTFKSLYGAYIDTLERFYYGGDRYNDTMTEAKDTWEEYKKVCNDCENKIRELVGYRKIGESHINETILYMIIKELFPELTILREYSPDWLNRKRLDIYISKLNIGIEYQGEQHYKPVSIFGGEEGFEKNKREMMKN